MKPFKLTLILREDSAPHLYVNQIKEMIANDRTLHPSMKGALKIMKKMKMPFIRLADKKEIVIVPELYLHFERAMKPEIHPWGKIEWSEEEKEDYDKDQKKFIREMLELYNTKLGYDFHQKEDVTDEELDNLIKITAPKKKK